MPVAVIGRALGDQIDPRPDEFAGRTLFLGDDAAIIIGVIVSIPRLETLTQDDVVPLGPPIPPLAAKGPSVLIVASSGGATGAVSSPTRSQRR